MTEKDTIWNRFIDEICDRDAATLSPVQKKAVLCFWYDAEMQNGGHSGYLGCYPETKPEELEDAILTVGSREMADNYRKAITDGDAFRVTIGRPQPFDEITVTLPQCIKA